MDFEQMLDVELEKQKNSIKVQAGMSMSRPSSHAVLSAPSQVRRRSYAMDDMSVNMYMEKKRELSKLEQKYEKDINKLKATVSKLRETIKAMKGAEEVKQKMIEISEVRVKLPKVHKILLLFSWYRKIAEKAYLDAVYTRYIRRFSQRLYNGLKENPTGFLMRSKSYNPSGRIEPHDYFREIIRLSREKVVDKYHNQVEFERSLMVKLHGTNI